MGLIVYVASGVELDQHGSWVDIFGIAQVFERIVLIAKLHIEHAEEHVGVVREIQGGTE